MSQPQKSFDRKFILHIKGVSRAFPEEETYSEKRILFAIETMIKAIKSMPGLTRTLIEWKEVKHAE